MPHPEKSRWLEVRAKAWADFPEDEKAAIIRASNERKANAKARHGDAVKRAFRINAAIISGKTVDEIAADEGMPVSTLWTLRRKWGFQFGKKAGLTLVTAWIKDEMSDALAALAVDMGTDQAGALSEIMKWALDTDAMPIRREMRVKRRALQEEAVA